MESINISDLSIALIEPSHTQQRIILKHLADLGISDVECYTQAASAQAGIHKLVPDLVISSMHLPDMTAGEFVQLLRSDPKVQDVPFMLISSETSYRYLEPLRQAGVVAILPKPFNPEDLKRALFAALDFIVPDYSVIDDEMFDSLNVLVVDDSSASRRHVRRILENMGIEKIYEVANGKEAIEQIEQNFFDLVVTDYHMPEMDGMELTTYIRENSSQSSVPVLMVTSEEDQSRLAVVKQAGVSAVCDKPFEPANVKAFVKKILAS
jgi:two-component system chemotaxis response regulator CheY